ncbi:hypothetical protein [Ramlibacter sp. AN1133]|uniref:hypothetical protein n=1 Tax=Ramlibacter sp. AN1133 TaxID=3133429 RepID=UPI0030BBEAAF
MTKSRLHPCRIALFFALLAWLPHAASAGLDELTEQEKMAAPQDIRQVWDNFVVAIAQGNLEQALGYIEPHSEAVPALRAQGVRGMQNTLADVVHVGECAYQFSVFAKCTMVRRLSPESHRALDVRFVRTGGRWYLSF